MKIPSASKSAPNDSIPEDSVSPFKVSRKEAGKFYLVSSDPSDEQEHEVNINTLRCSCGAFKFGRGRLCKHLIFLDQLVRME